MDDEITDAELWRLTERVSDVSFFDVDAGADPSVYPSKFMIAESHPRYRQAVRAALLALVAGGEGSDG